MFGKEIFGKLFIIPMLLIILIGCSNEATEETTESSGNENDGEVTSDQEELADELNIAYSAQPPTLDPHLTTAVATSDIMRGTYETLVTVDEEYNFQPMLADSYDMNEDGTVITFHLREGVPFHNGEEMTAEDVVASMDRWVEISSNADPLEGATFEAEDDYTVVMTLPEPMSITFSILSGKLGSFAAIMPKEVAEGAPETGLEEFIGTGPYEFDEWQQDAHVRLTKFDDYQSRSEEPSGLAGEKEALVENVYFRIVTDPSTRVNGIMTGEYDMAHATPYDYVETLEEDSEIENHTVPGSTFVLTFNEREGLFTDIEAREAARLAVDNETVLQGATTDETFYTLNHNLVMPELTSQFDSDAGRAEYEEYDLDQAADMFEEQGYAGEEVVLVTTRDYEDQYNASVIIQQQLEQAGLNVELEVYDWPTLLERREDPGTHDLNIMGWGPRPEPSGYGFLRDDEGSGWADREMLDDLKGEFRSQPTLEDTEDAYEAILQWVADDVPLMKIGDSNRIVTARDSINNYQYHDGFIIWNMSVSEE